MIVLWHFFVHWSGSDYGATYGVFIPYDFWSGITGSFLVGMTAFITTWYIHHTCHDSWRCLRFGKYAAAGGMFKLCRHHHPDLKGTRPHSALIALLHDEHKLRIGIPPRSGGVEGTGANDVL